MLDSIFLGILQGIFEWIPISSEGIVSIVAQFLFKKTNPLDLALFLHLGTLFAVLIYFRKDWILVLSLKDKKLLKFLIISTLFSGFFGFLLYEKIKSEVIGVNLLLLAGFGLLITAFFHKFKINFGLENFNLLAIISGILQGFAVLPGLSRSGATIFGLSFGKLKPKEILKISYMMSAPPILGMSLFLGLKNPILPFESLPALFFSFLFGILTLNFLIKVSQKINFFKFALIFSILCFLGAILQIFCLK